MSLRTILSDYWFAIQQELFLALKEELGPLGERYESLIAVLELVRVERLLPYFHGLPGRPQEDRAALGGPSSPRRYSISPPPGRCSSG